MQKTNRLFLLFMIIIPILIGIGLITMAFLADKLGTGQQSGFGEKQLFVLFVGVSFMLLGLVASFSSGRSWIVRIFSDMFVKPVRGVVGNDPRLPNIVIWFGIVTGLVEGVALWGLRKDNLLSGAFYFMGPSIDTIWASLVFDVLLFVVIGFLLQLVNRLFRNITLVRLWVFVFLFLTVFDWLAILLVGRVSIYALFVLAVGLSFQLTSKFLESANAFLDFLHGSLKVLTGCALAVVVIVLGGQFLKEKVEISRLDPVNKNPPNVLLIVVDTLRADHLSAYGYNRKTSPAIDEYAKQGILFENAISTADWTKPAHASMLTGLFVYQHQADLKPLDDRYMTVGEAFVKSGYRTAGISANIDVFSRTEGLGRGFIHFEDHFHTIGDIVVNTVYGRIVEFYVLHDLGIIKYRLNRRLGSEITQASLDWIGENNQKPFFVMLNYFDIHSPYIPPEPYRSAFSPLSKPGGIINTDWDMSHIYVPMTKEQEQGEIDAYDGAILYTDEQIRVLLSTLDKRGILNNTIVMIVADHGESFGEHGLLEHHNSLYREVVHVPLIVLWPGHIPSGIRINQPVSIASIPSTLLELSNNSSLSNIPGPSLTSLWENPASASSWPDPLAEVAQAFWLPPQHLPYSGSMKAVVNSTWEYIIHDKFGEELYSWQNDVAQEKNLAKEPDKLTVLDYFRGMLRSIIPGHTK